MTSNDRACALAGLAMLAVQAACGGAKVGSPGPDQGSMSSSTSASPGVSTASSGSTEGTSSSSSCATGDCIEDGCTSQFDSRGCWIGCRCVGSSSSSSSSSFLPIEHQDSGQESQPDCGAPAVTTYACAPIEEDAGGCRQHVYDGGADVFYPFGCVATQPECASQAPVTCTCMPVAFPGGPPGFVCPL